MQPTTKLQKTILLSNLVKTQNIVSTIALVAIAINLSIQTLRPSQQAEPPQKTRVGSTVAEVVSKLDPSEHSRFYRARPPAFLVKNGDALEVINYDPGSRFDVAPAPKFLLITEAGGQEKLISPLFMRVQ